MGKSYRHGNEYNENKYREREFIRQNRKQKEKLELQKNKDKSPDFED
jgi:hypothetical protein